MATLLIHAIECVAVSDSKLTPEAKDAINTSIDITATIATAVGGYGAIVAGALKIGKEIFNAIGDIGEGPDQLYLNLSNQEREHRIWPLLTEYYEVQSNQKITELSSKSIVINMPFPVSVSVPMVGPLKINFHNEITVNFWEWDSGSSDDFMGRLSVNESSLGKMMLQVVGNADQGSLYTVVYSVEAPRWASLGGIIQGEPATIATLDGQLAIVGRGADNAIWWKKQITFNGDWENHWNSLGAPSVGVLSSPSVAINANGAIVVFVQGGDNAIWHRWQTARNSTIWSDWVSLGGSVTSAPSAVLDKNGCLAVFARGIDNAIWHRWQQISNGEWSANWHSLGGIATSAPSATLNADQQVVVVVRSIDNAIWHRWQTQSYKPSKPDEIILASKEHYGTWVDNWLSLEGYLTSAPTICLNAEGGLVIFARGADNSIWHRWQTRRNGDWFTTWESLYGEATSAPSATLSQDGRLVVFTRGTDNAVWQRWQISRNGNWF